MDSELIIYLIFLAIFVISRLLKKPKQTPPSGPDQSSQRPNRQPKTFEELLEEFTQGPTTRTEVEEEIEEIPETKEIFREKPRYQSEKTRQELEEARYRGEAPKYKTRTLDTSYKGYEGLSGDELRTLDEQVDLENIRTKSLMASEEEERLSQIEGHTIRDILADPLEARKAIILAEIIGRRY